MDTLIEAIGFVERHWHIMSGIGVAGAAWVRMSSRLKNVEKDLGEVEERSLKDHDILVRLDESQKHIKSAVNEIKALLGGPRA